MATAEEILAGMTAEETQQVLVIDSDLRRIAIPEGVRLLGVTSDDDVLRLRFAMPRMCGEFDLSAFALRINYLNAGSEGDVYPVADAETDGDTIRFSWLVGRHACKYKGDVCFIVCAKLTGDGGEIEKEFNTTLATLPVLEGLETGEAIVQAHPDVIEAILRRLDTLEQESGGVSAEAIAAAVAAYLTEHPVEAGATAEQAAQIEANRQAIEELKESGVGTPGADGQDGVSPTVTVEAIEGGHRVTITDANGTQSFDVMDGATGETGATGATGATGQAGADGKDGQDGVSPTVTVETIEGGHRVTITDANGTQSFDVMDGADGQDGAGGSGSSVELDTTLTQSGQAADAKTVGDRLNELNEANAAQDTEIARKANDAELAKVAKSGSYTDLTNKPTIPTVPEALKNPNKLTFTGAVTAEYDGSSAVSVEIPAGSIDNLPIASPTTLGGVMPVAATESMTQDVGVTSDGKLKAPAVSAPSDEQVQNAVNAFLAENPVTTGAGTYKLVLDEAITEGVSSATFDLGAEYEDILLVFTSMIQTESKSNNGILYVSAGGIMFNIAAGYGENKTVSAAAQLLLAGDRSISFEETPGAYPLNSGNGTRMRVWDASSKARSLNISTQYGAPITFNLKVYTR